MLAGFGCWVLHFFSISCQHVVAMVTPCYLTLPFFLWQILTIRPYCDRNILFFAIILSAVLPIVPTPIEQDWSLGSLGFHAGSRMGFATG